jgi:hypothetical protein
LGYGNANDLFQTGIRANMQQMAEYDASAAISDAAIQTYLNANPLNTATALEQINTQYWVTSFLNGLNCLQTSGAADILY